MHVIRMMPLLLLPPTAHTDLPPPERNAATAVLMGENNIMYLYSRSCGRALCSGSSREKPVVWTLCSLVHVPCFHNVHVNIPQPAGGGASELV